MNAVTHNRHGLVRVPWRIAVYLILLGLLILSLSVAAAPLLKTLLPEDAEVTLTSLPPQFVALNNLLLIAALLAASLLLARRLDHRPLAGVGLGLHSQWKYELSVGLLLEVTAVAAIGLILCATGSLTLVPSRLAIDQLCGGFLMHILLFTTVAIQEELIFRGYLLQVLAEGIGKVKAALLLSVPFGIMHYFNEAGNLVGVLSTSIAGLLFSYAYFRTRSLWLPIGMHTAWNLALSWGLSLPVSGERLKTTPFLATTSGPDWWSGGPFGPEASILFLMSQGVVALVIARTRNLDPSVEAIAWYPPPEERGRFEEKVPDGAQTRL